MSVHDLACQRSVDDHDASCVAGGTISFEANDHEQPTCGTLQRKLRKEYTLVHRSVVGVRPGPEVLILRRGHNPARPHPLDLNSNAVDARGTERFGGS